MNCSSCGERIRAGSAVTPIHVPAYGYGAKEAFDGSRPIPRMNDHNPPWGEHPEDFDYRELCEVCAKGLA